MLALISRFIPAVVPDEPIETLPLVSIRIRSNWLFVLKTMLSDVPAPLVDSRVNVDDAVVPPIISGDVVLVVPESVVNVPAAAVVPPIDILSIVPSVPDEIVIVPAPVVV